MPCEPQWTAEEDRLLLSLTCANGLETACNEIARLMNEQAPNNEIYVRIYYPSTVYFRMVQLMRPNYQFMTEPLKFNDAHKYDLGRKREQKEPTEQASNSSQLSATKSTREEEEKKNTEGDVSTVLELYGEPELYVELFPQLTPHNATGEKRMDFKNELAPVTVTSKLARQSPP